MQIAPLFYPLSLVEINLKKRLRNRTKPLNVTLANFNFTGKMITKSISLKSSRFYFYCLFLFHEMKKNCGEFLQLCVP